MAVSTDYLMQAYALSKQLEYWKNVRDSAAISDIAYAKGKFTVSYKDGGSQEVELPKIEAGTACAVSLASDYASRKYRQTLTQTVRKWDAENYDYTSQSSTYTFYTSGASTDANAYKEPDSSTPYDNQDAYTNQISRKIGKNLGVLDVGGQWASASATGVSASASVANVGVTGLKAKATLLNTCLSINYLFGGLSKAWAVGVTSKLSGSEVTLAAQILSAIPLLSHIITLCNVNLLQKGTAHGLMMRTKSFRSK